MLYQHRNQKVEGRKERERREERRGEEEKAYDLEDNQTKLDRFGRFFHILQSRDSAHGTPFGGVIFSVCGRYGGQTCQYRPMPIPIYLEPLLCRL